MIRSLALIPFFAAALLQAQQLDIVEASYGAGNFQMNVAQKLRGMISNNVLEITVDPALLGGDPAPGSAKRLRVQYRHNGRQYEASAGDFERLRIPGQANVITPQTPTVTAPAAAAAAGGFSLGELWGNGANSALKVTAARYGDGTRNNDVRERLQNLVRNDALSVKVDNTSMGGDPAVARNKRLEVTYEFRGAQNQVTVKEGETLSLPPTSMQTSAPPAPQLRIVSARYGGDNRYNDVRERVQGLVQGAALAVKVDNATMGSDPAVGKDKALEVTYELNGATYAAWAKEGKTLTLPDPQATPIPTQLPTAATAAPATAPARTADSEAARRSSRVGGPVVTASGGRELVPIGNAGGLRIFYARYGANGTEIDVRERFRPLLQNDAVNTVVGAESMGSDPVPGVGKTVRVIYEFRGRTFEKIVGDGQALVLP